MLLKKIMLHRVRLYPHINLLTLGCLKSIVKVNMYNIWLHCVELTHSRRKMFSDYQAHILAFNSAEVIETLHINWRKFLRF
jgi:hypothetical protein